MKDNVSAAMVLYKSQPTSYIVFTICAVILIRVLHDVITSLSSCSNVRENASRAMELGGKAYTAYQDIRQPQRFIRQ